jgi:hypothetical protein
MDNKKVTFFVVLGFFLLSLMAAGYFLYRLWVGMRQEKATVTTPTSKVNLQSDSIVKETLLNNGGFIYEIQGSFANSLEKFGNSPLLRGEFVVKGDPSNQKIHVYLGSISGYCFLGTYSGSFNGGSTWSRVPTVTIPKIIKPGVPVKLKLTYSFTGEAGKGAFNDLQNILDDYSKAINNGREYKIPVDFNLSTESFGIIK